MDRAYYKLKELFTPDAHETAYEQGYSMGKTVMKAAILAELRQDDLHQWSDQRLKLGYEVALGRIKEVKR
jgi:hypothetical protein